MSIIAGVAIVILAVCVSHKAGSTACVPLIPVEESNDRIDFMDQSALRFSSTSHPILGRSEGGGEQINYSDNEGLQIVEQRFYGETGRAYQRFYYNQDGVMFAITKLNLSYDVPIYVDPSATIGASEKKDFYLNRKGTICRWFLNDVEQTVDGDTQDMIREYIAGIL